MTCARSFSSCASLYSSMVCASSSWPCCCAAPIGVMPLTSACEMFAPRVSSADTASARLRSTATRSGVLPTSSSGSTPMVLSSISSSARIAPSAAATCSGVRPACSRASVSLHTGAAAATSAAPSTTAPSAAAPSAAAPPSTPPSAPDTLPPAAPSSLSPVLATPVSSGGGGGGGGAMDSSPETQRLVKTVDDSAVDYYNTDCGTGSLAGGEGPERSTQYKRLATWGGFRRHHHTKQARLIAVHLGQSRHISTRLGSSRLISARLGSSRRDRTKQARARDGTADSPLTSDREDSEGGDGVPAIAQAKAREQAAGSSRSAVIGAAAAAAAAVTTGSRDALRTALHQNSVEAEALRARLRQLEEERRQLEQLLG
mmetsp:Transcript_19613/g.66176  ORF Transcript_19613/g.66176 Transcript_19613/m.66176 type:complete len:372 (+) Transcript_19613:217-1332(+)